MRKSALAELMASQPGELTAMRAHAKLLAIQSFNDQLESLITDAKVRGLKRTPNA